MISMPLPEIIQKIKEGSGLSEDEINKRIRAKLDLLSGLISKEGAAHIIANELGVKLAEEGPMQIKNLHAGLRNVEITGKVTTKFEVREFTSGERKGKVASLILGDPSGTVRLVLWNDQADIFPSIKEGDVIRITQGMVKENNGRKEVHVNSTTKLELNPKGIKVDVKEATVAPRKKIADLVQGDDNVEVFGTIVQVFDIRFFEVCPKCGKRVSRRDEEVVCEAHGPVTADYAYVLNVFIDDGSGNMRVVLWRNQAQKLLKMADDDIKALRGNPQEFEKKKSDLLGNFVKMVGRVNKPEGFDNLEFVPRLVFPDPDPKKEIEALAPEAPKKAPSERELKKAVGGDDDFLSLDEEDFEE